MKFKIDENLPTELVQSLRAAGHDAMSVLDQGMGGESDENLAARCIDESRAIVTLDLDFADIRKHPPEIYSGLIVLRVAHQEKRHLLQVFSQVMPLLASEPLVGNLWIADESGVRIRGENS